MNREAVYKSEVGLQTANSVDKRKRNSATTTDALEMRALASIRPNPLNPRSDEEPDEGFADLVESVRQSGILQPLLVTPDGVIVAGHRRVRAARAAGLSEVPVLVRDLDETQQIEAMLIENVQRKSLNPIGMARACAALRDRGLSVAEIAAKTGIGKMTVEKHLEALTLPRKLQEWLVSGKMPFGYVRPLAELRSEAPKRVSRSLIVEKQVALAEKAVRKDWRVELVRNEVADILWVWEPQAVQRKYERQESAPRPPAAPAPPSCRPVSPGKGKGVASAAPTSAVPPAARVGDHLCQVVRIVRENPSVLDDATVRSWLGEFAALVRKSQPT